MRVLITGASGYIGARLIPCLNADGHQLRVLVRNVDAIRQRDWFDEVEVVKGDATDDDSLQNALADIDVAYYLLHSMDGKGDFESRDRQMAQTFAKVAEQQGVKRIVYLSGLHPEDEKLSHHLGSRVEVGEVFLASSVPSIVFQAGIIIGAGSASLEMLRYLTQRLPFMIAPKWLDNRIQPIAIEDVLYYLRKATDLPANLNREFDIGGPDIVKYSQLIQAFAKADGRRRRTIVRVPVLTPKLASHWVGIITPVPAGIAKPLVESLIHEVTCHNHEVANYIPDPSGGLTSIDDALQKTLEHADTSWRPEPGDAQHATVTDADPAWAQKGPLQPPLSLKSSRARQIYEVIFCSVAVSATALVGGVASSATTSRWYARLNKPQWQPPSYVFPIVWTALYIDIDAVSSQCLIRLKGRERTMFRVALICNLILNASWSWFFFRFHRLWISTVVAGLLAASSADLARRAGTVDERLGNALAPYAAWCSFATALTNRVRQLN